MATGSPSNSRRKGILSSYALLLLCFSTTHGYTLQQTSLSYRASCSRRQASILEDAAGIHVQDDDDDNDDPQHLLELKAVNDAFPSHRNGKKKRSHNAAMADTAFLRKRTSNILSQSAEDHHLSRNMKVDRKTFHFLIDAWAFSREPDAAEKARRLVERMEELPRIQPDVRSYTKLINAIARCAQPTAGSDADTVLARMQHVAKKNPTATPNTYTYTAVIEAHSNSGAPESAERAAELCELMVEKYRNGDGDVTPTARAFNGAISSYAKSGEDGAARKAEELFRRLEELYSEGITDAKPNSFNYNSLISAWANCKEEGSPQRAEEVLERMEKRYEQGDEDVRPRTVSFNTVIDAYAKCGEPGAAAMAEQVLRNMEELYETGENVNAKPNVRSFNSVINAWAKSGEENAAWKAQAMLDMMDDLSREGNEDVQPDAHSFSTVINAWARSHDSNKAERALNLFREMKKLHENGNTKVRPNVVAANAVINACAFTQGDVRVQNRALEIAQIVLKDLEEAQYGEPDQITYGTFLKVCQNQMPASNSRDQVVEVLFKKCTQDGQLGDYFLQQMKVTASRELFESIIGKRADESVRLDDLPSQWSANVVDKRPPRSRR